MQDWKTGHWFDFQFYSVSLLRIDDYHWIILDSSLTVDHCFDEKYVGNKPMAWKKNCVDYWWNDTPGSKDSYSCSQDITEITVLEIIPTHLTTFYFNTFLNKPWFLRVCMSFENTVGKGEIARYDKFLPFPQCFY